MVVHSGNYSSHLHTYFECSVHAVMGSVTAIMVSDNRCAGQWNCCHSLAHISLFVNLITQILCRCHPQHKHRRRRSHPQQEKSQEPRLQFATAHQWETLSRPFVQQQWGKFEPGVGYVCRDGKTICLCTVVERIFRSASQHPNNRDILLSCLSLQELSNPALSFETTGSPKGIRPLAHKRGGIMKYHIRDYPTSKSCPQQRRALATCCWLLRGHSWWTPPLAPSASHPSTRMKWIHSVLIFIIITVFEILTLNLIHSHANTRIRLDNNKRTKSGWDEEGAKFLCVIRCAMKSVFTF